MQPSVRRISQDIYCVSLAEARDHLRIETDDSDKYVASLIAVAHEYVVSYTGRALTKATYEMTMDRFPRRTGPYRNDASTATSGIPYPNYWIDDFPWSAVPIELPYAPVFADDPGVSVSYTNFSGVTRTLDPAEYTLDLHAIQPTIRPPYSKAWPTDCQLFPNSVRVQWNAGYGDISQVSPQIKHATLILISHFFENRDDSSSMSARRNGTAVPIAVDALLSSVSSGHYSQVR